ncbi:betaine/proline/choline family ABC transporter ATP-binding protein [Salicibibacter cibi]|uniref:Quaternary amine transport ATP-binding protein n=1 Tax=Salicibibacter cibi TaxID=2743001 RepID=A0A7T6ZB27_9BACI|nr:betaine/proline/choline family ABC transporter ATP-binding protein [Salicibibacter cibi]QQK80151.1 betaine/proline/choline family ABC transporter ATP-binding protein [Salicibibacter cibi]
MIRLENIKKTYADGFQALKNINLHFEQGQLNVLIGPSGCGKTTTMKLLNRLIEPSDGTILVDGKDISSIDPVTLRRETGYVIQHVGLFPHMTIKENVASVPRLLKWDNDKIEKRVNELLHLVHLDPDTFKHRYPSELSGGQQQRIGVIRALAAEPPVILMDEPFSALDPISREQLQDELVRLQKEINKTIVFVTHDIDEALKIGDQIILMRDGEVEQKGTPNELLSDPVSDFAIDFIGEHRLNKARKQVRVEDLMTKCDETLFNHSDLQQALEMMRDRKTDRLFVVDNENVLKGYVDIYQLMKEKDEAKLVNAVQPFKSQIKKRTSLKDALQFMNSEKINESPVMEENRVIGMLTYQHVFNYLQTLDFGKGE